MRTWIVLAFLLTLAAGFASAAIPSGQTLVATGTIHFSGRICTHDVATLTIERGYSPEEKLIYVGTGTGMLQYGSTDPRIGWNYVPYQACGTGFIGFGGGQCFECEGSCRILGDGTAECWDGGNGEPNEPDPNGGGEYLRLSPDGSLFYFYRHGNPPWDPDFEIHGQMTRLG